MSRFSNLRGLAATTAVVAFGAVTQSAIAAPAPTITAGKLTVGVSLPSEGFQVGVVSGEQVLYARGYEVDLASELATRLELTETNLLQQDFQRLISIGDKPWDIALAEVTETAQRATHVNFSTPYMRVDQGVMLSQYVQTIPSTLASMRKLRFCAMLGTTGVTAVRGRVKPTAKAKWYRDVPSLMLALQVGTCDAVMYDLPALATLQDRAPERYGAIAGKVATGEEYAVVMPKSSTLGPRVDAALASLRSDGTLAKLERRWLSQRLSSFRTLR